jgi:hypothetical protein
MADAQAQVAHDMEAAALQLDKLRSHFTATLETPHITLCSLDGSKSVHTLRQAMLAAEVKVQCMNLFAEQLLLMCCTADGHHL